MTGLTDSNTSYKSLRLNQDSNLELRVTNVMDVIENHYFIPLCLDMTKDILVNISIEMRD